MKKTLLMVALLAGLGTANAQISSGRFFIGGDVLSFSSVSGKVENTTTTNTPTTTSFGIQPTFGYYFSDNWAIGIKLGYMNTTQKNNVTEDKTSTNLVTASPFIRYNMALTDKFAFFVDGGVRFETGSTKITYSPAPPAGQPLDTKLRNFGVNVGPGFLWFVRDNIAIQGSIATLISFNSQREEDPNTTPNTTVRTTNSFGLNLNGGIGLGMYYYFGGNK